MPQSRSTGRRSGHDLCPELFEVEFTKDGVLESGQVPLDRAINKESERVIVSDDHGVDVAQLRGGVPVKRVTVVRSTPRSCCHASRTRSSRTALRPQTRLTYDVVKDGPAGPSQNNFPGI